MNTHLLFMATANHARHEGARLLANIDAEQLSDGAIKATIAMANEFRVASSLAQQPARQQQLLDRVRVCLELLADVEEDLMQAAGER